ncbi:MAG: 50S ribosomal protein L17 [Bradymonadales bacterium]|jgi:large subunit ribosomal protein L17
MRHRKSGRKLSRTSAHRKALYKNLATALLREESIQTTEAKAKELRSVVDKLITLGKRGDMHARRLAAARINEQCFDRNNPEESKKNGEILRKLFDDIAIRNKDRNGGYTRIIKLDRRHGDNAPIVRIELVERTPVQTVVEQVAETAAD